MRISDCSADVCSSDLLGHESAVGHVTGHDVYTDKQYPGVGLLSLYPVQAPHAHASILSIDSAAARAMPGVHLVLTAADIPGENNTGTIVHDEPLIPLDVEIGRAHV